MYLKLKKGKPLCLQNAQDIFKFRLCGSDWGDIYAPNIWSIKKFLPHGIRLVPIY